jgi:transcriptional regulator with XRE-family HTH domain
MLTRARNSRAYPGDTLAAIMTGEQLQQWREHQGLSVVKAAQMLGVSRNAFYLWTRGEQPVPKAVELACAAITLGVRSYPPSDDSSAVSKSAESFVLAAPFSGPPGAPRD